MDCWAWGGVRGEAGSPVKIDYSSSIGENDGGTDWGGSSGGVGNGEIRDIP